MFVGFIHVHDILNRIYFLQQKFENGYYTWHVCLKFCDNPSLFTGRSIQPFVQVFALLILEELFISVIIKKTCRGIFIKCIKVMYLCIMTRTNPCWIQFFIVIKSGHLHVPLDHLNSLIQVHSCAWFSKEHQCNRTSCQKCLYLYLLIQ